ncbi:MAG: hypothetical protein IIA45_01760, partial [Bacteroidetes bacterium]|nr:hypothetical protein [Bacteroidota bacterium]
MGKKSGSFEVQQFGDNKSSRKGQDAVLVGAITKDQTEEAINEYLDELAFLASTAGLQIIKRFTQRQQNSHPGTFLGKGKLEEIADYNKSRNISLIIFDDELSGTQLNNIQNICNCEV